MKKIFVMMSLVLMSVAILSCSGDDMVCASPTGADEVAVEENTNPNLLSIDDARRSMQDALAQMQSAVPTRSAFDLQDRQITSEYAVDLPSLKATHGSIQDIQVIDRNDTLKLPKLDAKLLQRWQALNRVYFFNFGDGDGYAIVSGDVKMSPILVLSNSGSITPTSSIPFDILLMMTKVEAVYRDELIRDIMHQDEEMVYDTRKTVTKTYYPSSGQGLCPVKWGQSYPYNIYCPEIDGTNALTGCVATAVAQLMAACEYPSSYNGYTFDWGQMKSGVGKEQVARLMQQLGLPENLDVDYGVAASGAYSKNIPRTLQHFGYENGGTYDKYNTATISSELKKEYPVLISGSVLKNYSTFNYSVSPSAYVGHQWLGHGLYTIAEKVEYINVDNGHVFDTKTTYTEYVLCNFGWWGAHDGYYLNGVYNTESGPAIVVTRGAEAGESESELNAAGPVTDSGNDPYDYINLYMVTGIRN